MKLSLESPPDSDIESEWIAEAKRRDQELLDGRGKGIPGEQVRAVLEHAARSALAPA